MGKIESQWRQSITRRSALRGLSVLFAGSPLFLQAQKDPHPLRDSRRALGIDEMVTAFDFEPIFHANLPLPIFSYMARTQNLPSDEIARYLTGSKLFQGGE